MPKKLNPLDRSAYKALRDMLVMFVSAGILTVAENMGDFGLPEAFVPVATAIAFFLYRLIRDRNKGDMEL